MAIQLLSNLNYPIGNIVNQELQNASSAKIAVAFLKYSGLKVIEQSLNHCQKNKGNVEIIAGLDFKTTGPQSMHYLINLQKQEQTTLRFRLGTDNKIYAPTTAACFSSNLHNLQSQSPVLFKCVVPA